MRIETSTEDADEAKGGMSRGQLRNCQRQDYWPFLGRVDDFLDSQGINNVYRSRTAPRIKYGRKLAPVVRELGYPSKRNLRRWIRLWEASDGATEVIRRKPRDSYVQEQAAVEYFLNNGCCLAFTSRTLGYPPMNRGIIQN